MRTNHARRRGKNRSLADAAARILAYCNQQEIECPEPLRQRGNQEIATHSNSQGNAAQTRQFDPMIGTVERSPEAEPRRLRAVHSQPQSGALIGV
jgi:hypothetical protein